MIYELGRAERGATATASTSLRWSPTIASTDDACEFDGPQGKYVCSLAHSYRIGKVDCARAKNKSTVCALMWHFPPSITEYYWTKDWLVGVTFAAHHRVPHNQYEPPSEVPARAHIIQTTALHASLACAVPTLGCVWCMGSFCSCLFRVPAKGAAPRNGEASSSFAPQAAETHTHKPVLSGEDCPPSSARIRYRIKHREPHSPRGLCVTEEGSRTFRGRADIYALMDNGYGKKYGI